MRTRLVSRSSLALGFCLILTPPASPQSGSIGPTKGQVIAAVAGAGAALGAAGYVIYHETHKHPIVMGCLATNADGLSLTDEKNRKVYVLTGNLAALQAGEKVAIKGKKSKDPSGKQFFQVEKLTKDLGPCQP